MLTFEHGSGCIVHQSQTTIKRNVRLQKAPSDELSENAAPLSLGQISAYTKGADFVVIELRDGRCHLAHQHINQMRHPKTLACAIDARQGFLCFYGRIPSLHRLQAVVAIGTQTWVTFPKVAQYSLMAASGRLAKAKQGIEFLPFNAFTVLRRFTRIHHFAQIDHIAKTINHPSIGRQSIPASSAGFLVIAFHAFGQIQVGHKAHIGLVNSHAKRHRCHHDDPFFTQKPLLMGIAHLGAEPRVVRHGVPAAKFEPLCCVLNALAGQTIHNP